VTYDVTDRAPTLAAGRRVSVLPRAGGRARGGTVQVWDASGDRVVARIHTDADAVADLDHHQVWLSTVSRHREESGITIFAGRASALDPESLQVEGVVRLADERRRRALRAGGAMVTLPPARGEQQTVAALDISRGGVRLALGEDGWSYEDPMDLVLHLGDDRSLNVVGRLHRFDPGTGSAVLTFDGLHERYAEALDRFALTRLDPPPG
jgi:hypothetical protein